MMEFIIAALLICNLIASLSGEWGRFALTFPEIIICALILVSCGWLNMINRKLNRLHNWIAELKYGKFEE